LFVDEAKVYVKAGNGGDGLVTFRREKHVPRGGPSGGDGGKGGDVVFVVAPGLRTLLDFRYRQHLTAGNGERGGRDRRAGARGEDLVVSVPPGTVVSAVEDGRVIGDLTRPGQRLIVARGGHGGRGNARFASSSERAPTFAEKGEPGEELRVRLELKVMADAGLVGLPNAGKSTFLSRVSAARPKIAGYPFTTLEPNLGVVAVPGREGESFVLADIPGLIRGAHEGSGLGDRFLRHIERTRVLVHLVDVSPLAGQEPIDAYRAIREELTLYDPFLCDRPEIVVATKTDMDGAEERARSLEERLREEDADEGPRVLRASPLTGDGLEAVLHAVADALLAATGGRGRPEDDTPVEAEEDEDTRARDTRQARPGFDVVEEDAVFVVRGEDIERMVIMTDLEHEAALRHLQHRLKRRGVFRALRKAGARPGSTVRIGDFEFDFVE